MAYYLTEKQQQACNYFESLESFTYEQAEHAIRFCCSVCGCNREEQNYLLDWYFDGIHGDLMRWANKYQTFYQLLDYCVDCFILGPDDPYYAECCDALEDETQITGELLPTGRLFLKYI